MTVSMAQEEMNARERVLAAMPADESIDFWGIRRRWVHHVGGRYDEQHFHPLAFAQSIDDLDAYPWPSADWFDYSQMRAQAVAVRRTHVVKCGYMAPFYYHNLLHGLEQSLIDPLDDPTLLCTTKHGATANSKG